ncbi:hypothetical protein P3G55_19600 [Leptospira sp. 96542]|nr:hypothetical protein [Leptospira sp. 96542]
MKTISILFCFLILVGCAAYTAWHSEWRTLGNQEYFFASIQAKASAKATQSGSLAMRRTTCVDATNLLSTSSKLTATLVDFEKYELTETELKDLGRLIALYKIKPKQESCQSSTGSGFFANPAWETCECLYSIEYPGGRKKFREDLTQVK